MRGVTFGRLRLVPRWGVHAGTVWLDIDGSTSKRVVDVFDSSLVNRLFVGRPQRMRRGIAIASLQPKSAVLARDHHRRGTD